MILYKLTDWLSLIPLFVVVGFTIMGLVQLMQRKNILKVDKDILLLGGFYIVVLVMFLFFENNIINYRPVCIEGHLEASYPSSTTLLVMCVMPTTILQLQYRMQNIKRRKILIIVLSVFTAMMVLGRIISGVHWISDIIGGLLLSMGLVTFYDGLVQYNKCLK
ncbi:MAG: phosphatase PAP2 family protein [Faecalibacillus sp.]